MSIKICHCCKEKSFKILFCFVKKQQCRECYQEVCKNCWNSETCHICYVRDRPDANSVEKLKELESDELERLMKTLHLDPSKKSENDWINMIAQHCGLPMKTQPPEYFKDTAPHANGNGNQTTAVNKVEKAKANGVKKLKSPVKTHAVTSINGVQQNRSSLHSQIIHEMAAQNSNTSDEDEDDDRDNYFKAREEETESGIHMDDGTLTINRHKLSSSSESFESDHQQPTESPKELQIKPKAQSYWTNDTNSTLSPENFRKINAVSTRTITKTNEQQNPTVVRVEELNEIDVKILKNIVQRRPLTETEKLSLEKYESEQNVVKTSTYSRENRPTSSVEVRPKNDSKEAPISTNIKDIISHYGGRQQQQSTKKPLIEENIQVIEIKTNERLKIRDEKLKTTISINPPSTEPVKKPSEMNKKPPEPFKRLLDPLVTINSAKENDKIAEVHRSNVVASWQKVVNVNTATKRTSSVSKKEIDVLSKQILMPIEIVSKDFRKETVQQLQPVRTSVSSATAKDDKLNRESINLLLSMITSENDIQKMDIMQIRKILRQVNAKTGQTVIKKEELAEELRKLWCQANDAKKTTNDNSAKEVVIIVSNQPLRNLNTSATPPNRSSVAQVKVFNFNTISNEDQIRKLNIFQLKSLLTEDGLYSEVISRHSKDALVEKAIERWRNIKR